MEKPRDVESEIQGSGISWEQESRVARQGTRGRGGGQGGPS